MENILKKHFIIFILLFCVFSFVLSYYGAPIFEYNNTFSPPIQNTNDISKTASLPETQFLPLVLSESTSYVKDFSSQSMNNGTRFFKNALNLFLLKTFMFTFLLTIFIMFVTSIIKSIVIIWIENMHGDKDRYFVLIR